MKEICWLLVLFSFFVLKDAEKEITDVAISSLRQPDYSRNDVLLASMTPFCNKIVLNLTLW